MCVYTPQGKDWWVFQGAMYVWHNHSMTLHTYAFHSLEDPPFDLTLPGRRVTNASCCRVLPMTGHRCAAGMAFLKRQQTTISVRSLPVKSVSLSLSWCLFCHIELDSTRESAIRKTASSHAWCFLCLHLWPVAFLYATACSQFVCVLWACVWVSLCLGLGLCLCLCLSVSVSVSEREKARQSERRQQEGWWKERHRERQRETEPYWCIYKCWYSHTHIYIRALTNTHARARALLFTHTNIWTGPGQSGSFTTWNGKCCTVSIQIYQVSCTYFLMFQQLKSKYFRIFEVYHVHVAHILKPEYFRNVKCNSTRKFRFQRVCDMENTEQV